MQNNMQSYHRNTKNYRQTIFSNIALLMLTLLSLTMATSVMAAADYKSKSTQATDTVSATVLWYTEQESYTDEYSVRMIITDQYLRIDEGDDSDLNYVLFDRVNRIIYSTDAERQNYLIVKFKPVTIDSPIELNISKDLQPSDKNAPLFAGQQVKNYHLNVNTKVCYEVITVDNFQQDAIQALSDYRQVLAGEHASVLLQTPADLHEACDLALHTFDPTLIYQQGFPILERSPSGYLRVLSDFQIQQVKKSLLALPDDFSSFEL